jgi:hypothetical protein
MIPIQEPHTSQIRITTDLTDYGKLWAESLFSGKKLRTFRLPDGSYYHLLEAPETGEFPDEIDI